MDNWVPQGPLKSLVQGLLNRDEENLKVKEVLVNNAWNWDKISFDLPLSIKLEVQATPFAIAVRREDRLDWKTNSHGKFDLSSAYKLATPNDGEQVFRGHWIWKERINPRIQFFLWKCFHNSIGVNVCLNARGINLDPLCPRCKKEPETIIHMLHDCWK